MIVRDLQLRANGKFVAPKAGTAAPEEGVRLIKAFLRIDDSSVRNKILGMVEHAWADPALLPRATRRRG